MMPAYKPPTSGPLDWGSRIDNLLLEQRQLILAQTNLLQAVAGSMGGAGGGACDYFMPTGTPLEIRQQLESGSFMPYDAPTFDLSTAHNDFEIALQGQSIFAWSDADTLDGVGIKLNSTNAPIIYLTRFNPIKFSPFWKIYLTNPAVAGKSLQLFIGRACNTAPEAGTSIVQIAAPSGVVSAPLSKATTPVIYNVDLTLADTEYSQALPASTKKFLIHLRDAAAFRLAYVTGKVATPTAPYFSVPANGAYNEDLIEPAALTVYLASPAAAKVAEIIAWS